MKNTKYAEAALISRCERTLQGTKTPKVPSYSFRGMDTKIPSLSTGIGNATLGEQKVYTGDKMLGISQMHKSNAVPVFQAEDIIDISRMRR